MTGPALDAPSRTHHRAPMRAFACTRDTARPDRPCDTRAGRRRRRARRPDGTLKVRGEFAYSSDLWLDETLFGVTLRSPHPRARITGIDICRRAGRAGRVRRADPRRRARAPSTTASRSPTSRCSPSTRCATRASRSRSWPPTIRTPPAGRSPASRCRYEVLTPVTDAARPLRPGSAGCRASGRQPVPPPAGAAGRPGRGRRGRGRRRVRGRHAGPGLPRPGVRARRAGRRTAASTCTSRPSGCTSTRPRSPPASACPRTRSG